MTLEIFKEVYSLAGAMQRIAQQWPDHRVCSHWTQGEFHHDVAIDVDHQCLIISTNCNGGVKEVLLLEQTPTQEQLWHWRCPDNPDFLGDPIQVVEHLKTEAWHDPCEVLVPDARSELRPEFRRRQKGGGWEMK